MIRARQANMREEKGGIEEEEEGGRARKAG